MRQGRALVEGMRYDGVAAVPRQPEPLGTPAGPGIPRTGPVGPFSLCVARPPAYSGTTLLLPAALALAQSPPDTTMPALASPRRDDSAVTLDRRPADAPRPAPAVRR